MIDLRQWVPACTSNLHPSGLREYLRCTRPEGHDGSHEQAQDGPTPVIWQWDDDLTYRRLVRR